MIKSCLIKSFSVLSAIFLSCCVSLAEAEGVMTLWTLEAALEAKPMGAEAEKLAAQISTYFGKEHLAKGTAVRNEALTVAWALELAGAGSIPRVVGEGSGFSLTLHRVGNTDLYAGVTTLPEGEAFRWHFEEEGRKIGGGQLEVYSKDVDSLRQPGVPIGQVKQMPPWESRIFAGTTRDWWVYIPSQYRQESAACVLVFQDGGNYKESVPIVLDNLIAKNHIPVTVGMFIDPGVFSDGKRNRSFEYDTLSDQYARFLLEEILPEVEKTIHLRKDPASRAIAGISSGGICAFTAAWERPNEFSKVLSWVGSFVNIASGKTLREGGHNYAALIRKSPRKPIRVFLQGGANDLNNAHGNWPLANQQMAKALEFAGYDYHFVFGNGFHSNKHGLAVLPQALRWLWRDYKRWQSQRNLQPSPSTTQK